MSGLNREENRCKNQSVRSYHDMVMLTPGLASFGYLARKATICRWVPVTSFAGTGRVAQSLQRPIACNGEA